MVRNSKALIAILSGLLVLCMCGNGFLYLAWRVSGEVSTDATAVAAQIATYTAPAGYKEDIGLRIRDLSLVGLTNRSTGGMIFLAQLPMDPNVEQEELERQLTQAVQQRNGGASKNMQVVGYREAEIRGQRVNLTVSEGHDAAGDAVRQLAGIFQGENGVVMLMIMAPVERWNQHSIDAFIASIR